MKRVKRLLRKMESRGLEGLFLGDSCNISYLTASRSRDSYLLVSGKKSVYFTDSRYLEEARACLRGFEVREYRPSLWQAVAGEVKRLGLRRIGFDDKKMTFAAYRGLSAALDGSCDLQPAGGMVEDLRLVKSAEEIASIRKACRITMDALKYIRGFIVPGRTELEVAGELERFIRLKGAYASSFDIIVASGTGSSLPHHVTSKRKIMDNEPVYVDMGVDLEGYRSDLTRVFFLGKIPFLVKKAYKVVAEAQEEAIRQVRPGALAADIDACARRHISSNGLGKYFTHALGHGLGLEVHEGPRLAPGAQTRLAEGMVFTVEPAVYIPGKFGVRVEDMVLVTRKGSEVLSGALDK